MKLARHVQSLILAGAAIMSVGPSVTSAQGTIAGRVLAQGTNVPIPDARVMVVGTNAATATAQDGGFKLSNVRAGSVQVQVLRLGFQSQKQTVTVTSGQTSTADFRLEAAAQQLDDVVTTATGEQRKIELGNALATIPAAKLVDEVPIRDMTDLLVARAPSVSVVPGNYTGAGAQIRIRGLSSISNSGPPIYIVDGIRINTGGGIGLTGGGASTSRLNDISPSEIENIEIVRGPSAATLYGTDAANGVVVITTKRGRMGRTNWSFSTEGGLLNDRNEYPIAYANWGHAPGATTATRCTLPTISLGTCLSDSLTQANILGTKELTPIALGNRHEHSLQVSGGTELVRFFVSGTFENEVGPLKMPGFARARLDSLRIPIRGEWIRPSQSQRSSFRANINTSVSPEFDIGVTSMYFKTDQRGAQSDNNVNSYFYNALTNPGFIHAGLGFTNRGSLGQDLHGYGGFTPAEIFQSYGNEAVQRFGGTVNATWRPFTWLLADGTTGVDLTAADNVSHCYRDECADFGTQRQGNVSQNHSTDRRFTAKLMGTATWQPLGWVNLQSSVGGDYLNSSNQGTNASASVLGPGVRSVELGANRSTSNTSPGANKTLGLFVQEQAAFRDRLFLTAAVRTDQNSAFGAKFQRVYYPKYSVSWVMSDEPFFRNPGGLINHLRLRTAYGESGIQPGQTTALVTFSSSTVRIANLDESALAANNIGNANLRPERTSEWEGGLDLRMLSNRLNMELTYYSKVTKDALDSYSYAPSASASSSITRNLGGVKNAGVEASVSATLIDRRNFAFDISAGGSHNKNKVTHLGFNDAGEELPPTARTSTSRTMAGYPLNSVWYRPFNWNDDNGDGIITNNEVQPWDISKGDSSEYIGPSFPTDLANVTLGFDLLDRSLRITVLGSYVGGFNKFNNTQSFLCGQTASCYAAQNPDAPLWDQARHIAANSVLPATLRTTRGYSENLNFWRLREVTGNYTIPSRVSSRFFRARYASMMFGIRNLYVWSAYTGEDPEANYSTGNTQSDLLTAGPPTIFTFRLNLKY